MSKYIIKAFNYFMGFLFMFSLCALDSESWIPTILCAFSLIYLAVLVLNHADYYEGEEE